MVILSPSSVYIFPDRNVTQFDLTLYIDLNSCVHLSVSISSLTTGKRVKESVQFKNNAVCCQYGAEHPPAAAAIYAGRWKLHSLYRRLAGGVSSKLLRTDILTNRELAAALWQYLHNYGFPQ